MLTVQNTNGNVENRERNTARFSFRTTERIKQTVEHAASLLGQDTSTFAVNAAYQRALETIRSHEVTHLQPEDHEAFFKALEQPQEPTDKLREAFRRHREGITKR